MLSILSKKIPHIESDNCICISQGIKLADIKIHLLQEALQIWMLEYAKTRHMTWFCDK